MLDSDNLMSHFNNNNNNNQTTNYEQQQYNNNNNNNKDIVDSKDFFVNFNLNEISELRNDNLTLLSESNLIPSTSGTTIIQQQQFNFIDQKYDQTQAYLNNNNDDLMVDCNTQQLNNPPKVDTTITTSTTTSTTISQPQLSPVVISPSEIDSITIQLEKNQQCACKDCGKLFNSVWYLKQHAVKHSNDRPFKCKFCMKV